MSWTCRRVSGGELCRRQNDGRARKCVACGKVRPAKRKPAHMVALDLSYDDYVALNGGEHCGICGAVQKPGGRRLHRDHDHVTGQPRGILCFRCNTALPNRVTVRWLRKAVYYLERAEVS